jgi:hypothetical protein
MCTGNKQITNIRAYSKMQAFDVALAYAFLVIIPCFLISLDQGGGQEPGKDLDRAVK